MTAKEIKQGEIQTTARSAWEKGGEWGGLFMATGTGKSKIAIDKCSELDKALVVQPNILLIVPTERLRDDNWKQEFTRWKADKVYANIQRYCYASINKIEFEDFDLVIADEGHNFTELNTGFFEKNTVKRLMVLTATEPDKSGNITDKAKVLLFKQFRIKPDFVYTLDEARADGIVSPYDIIVVETVLDNTTKFIKAGSAAKPFMQTEQAAYDYVSTIIRKMMISSNPAVKWKSLERMRLIYNSLAKTEVARKLMDKVCPGNRAIVYCGSIAQAEKLCGADKVYHSKSDDKALNAFMAEQAELLGAVEALNEGINIPNVDLGIIVQVSSSAKDLIQRIGRLIRYRKGHIARIYIIVAMGTQDEKWFEKAIASFDTANISYIHAKNI